MTTWTLTPASVSPWTVPAGVTAIQVECWASGGGGSGAFGSGGGGGAYARKNSYAVTPGTTINFTCPSGGASNSDGSDCWFASTSVVLAKAGKAGQSPGTGLGGSATSCVGDAVFSGGNSGTTNGAQKTGGGSSAGTGAAGNNALSNTQSVGATAPSGGGNGGDGGDSGSSTAGAVPGGGGGGDSRNHGAASPGGAAKIIITDVTPVGTGGAFASGWW